MNHPHPSHAASVTLPGHPFVAYRDGSLQVDGVPQAGWNNVPASWFLLAKTQGLSQL